MSLSGRMSHHNCDWSLLPLAERGNYLGMRLLPDTKHRLKHAKRLLKVMGCITCSNVSASCRCVHGMLHFALIHLVQFVFIHKMSFIII